MSTLKITGLNITLPGHINEMPSESEINEWLQYELTIGESISTSNPLSGVDFMECNVSYDSISINGVEVDAKGNGFSGPYACCLASGIRMNGELVTTEHIELFEAAFSNKSIEQLREDGVDEYDLEMFIKNWAELTNTDPDEAIEDERLS